MSACVHGSGKGEPKYNTATQRCKRILRKGPTSYRLPSEFSVDQLSQIVPDRRLIEALDDFVQEAGDDEALGDGNGNPAGAKIKHFVFVDLARSGAVGTTDVIGENFEAGH